MPPAPFSNSGSLIGGVGGPDASQALALNDHSCPPVPTAAPRNVVVHGTSATQLDVTWEPLPLENQNGDIQGYKVGVATKGRGYSGAWLREGGATGREVWVGL